MTRRQALINGEVAAHSGVRGNEMTNRLLVCGVVLLGLNAGMLFLIALMLAKIADMMKHWKL